MYPEIIFKKKTKKQDFYKLLKMGNNMKKARFVKAFFIQLSLDIALVHF